MLPIQLKDNNLNFREELQEQTNQNLNACYQCKKCSAGCPVAYAMDYTPSQIMEAIRLGMKTLVLKSKTPWLCASCETCTTRCPQEIDIAKVMDAIKAQAIKQGIQPAIPGVFAFYKAALNTIKLFGRTYDIGLIMGFNLSTRQFFKDMALGIKMFKKGKLKLKPDMTFKGVWALKKIFSRLEKLERKRK